MSTRQRGIGLPWPSLIGLLLLFQVGSSHAAGNDPWAPFEAPWFDKVSSSEGLPPSIITALAQDRQGLLWVGTMVGLARDDGYRTRCSTPVAAWATGCPTPTCAACSRCPTAAC